MNVDRGLEESGNVGGIEFEWHSAKAEANLRKHKVAFDEAKTVFGDKKHLEIPDAEHSHDELRYLAIGQSDKGRILTLVFTERGTKLRLISARVAEAWERREYENANE